MSLRIFCLLSLLAFCHAGVLPLFDPRIVNGEDAKPGEIPYQVSLQYIISSFHFCGGSILNEDYVITAAQCVYGGHANEIKVVAGIIDLTESEKSEHNVERIITHEGYNSTNSWINDIALLKVKEPFPIKSGTIECVSLPPKDLAVNPNDVAVVSGWGRVKQGGPTTNKLQRVDVSIAFQSYCNYIYNDLGYNIYFTQVCTHNPSIEKGTCQGDSGGPLTIDKQLVGLVSWVYDCGSTIYPTVYTRIGPYLDWIEDHAITKP